MLVTHWLEVSFVSSCSLVERAWAFVIANRELTSFCFGQWATGICRPQCRKIVLCSVSTGHIFLALFIFYSAPTASRLASSSSTERLHRYSILLSLPSNHPSRTAASRYSLEIRGGGPNAKTVLSDWDVLPNKITRNIIVLSFKDSPRKPLGRRPEEQRSLPFLPVGRPRLSQP